MATARLLDDVTECPICTEVFKDPRVLPCVHTYCLHCIEQYGKDKQPGDKLACPLCRKEFTVPSNGLQELPKHFFIVKMLHIKELSKSENKTTPCEACSVEGNEERNSATVYCAECQVKFCDMCERGHRTFKATRSHKTVKLGEQLNPESLYERMPPTNCDKHQDESMKIYCFDCKIAICIMCYIKEHNSHKCSDVNEVVDGFRAQMENDVEGVSSRVATCKEMLEMLEKEKKNFTEQVSKTEKQILDTAEKLKQMIERHKQQLVNELTSMKQKRMKEIDSVRDKLEIQLLSVESYKKYVEELREKGTACDIARAKSGLRNRAQELLTFDVEGMLDSELGRSDVTFAASNFIIDDARKTLGEVRVGVDKTGASARTPTLTHVTPKGAQVCAVTSLGDDVFVARLFSSHQVEVYDAATLTLQRRFNVSGLGQAFGLAACASNNCIYVSDYTYNNVHKAELTGSNVAKWSVANSPRGLSVTSARNVLVACGGANKLQEYTTGGTIVREISISFAPWHAIELPSGQYVVTQYSSPGVVHVVGADGRIIKSCGQPETSTIGHMKNPATLAVTRDGDILVADQCSHRILRIDSSLSRPELLQLPAVDGGMKYPLGLWLDKPRRRLYVGEQCTGGRVLVYDGI